MNSTTPALVGANTTKKRVLSPLAKQLPINRCLFCHGTSDALDNATLGLGGAIICETCALAAAAELPRPLADVPRLGGGRERSPVIRAEPAVTTRARSCSRSSPRRRRAAGQPSTTMS